ncbi:SAM-dependent methyltransferase [Microvirga lotononidis]|uniref:Methyltransferase, cyclopropane fatty acid synthase n=1 Tax=Microvirga lotononidis TaxID=864069 RepID=I4YNX5_9HYPH|nr:cyclopropane-fatty-acyl-phospholipid synthase family protein [Microvirga lotononidis]EIM25667.1 methyltransferase, cyclopropane fatty acid synthase [Microvirga lotononidis]WQO26449.1 cyclopropane-fatty-acyl-phospholipid synthase family protein [Microvirga lotononidis]
MLSEKLLDLAFTRAIKHGTLEMITARGKRFTFGNGAEPQVSIRFTDAAAQMALCLHPELKLGELFVDGRLVIEKGNILDLLQLLLQDTHGELDELPLHRLRKIRAWMMRRAENDAIRSKRNVAHHYDLDGRLYALFLDGDRQYSCAYFDHPDASLEEAQMAKKRHIAAKLLVDPGHSVLDIGSGWGGMGLYLAQVAGAGSVKGITLSEEQLEASRKRSATACLQDRVQFELQDYRDTKGSFDRIVSVGMFEHVGVSSYDAYFQASRSLLKADGVMLLHTIGRTGTPYPTNPWITKYIFPGGHLPVLSEMMPAIERAGLVVTDIEILRLHYAYTLKAWRERFMAHREEVLRLYDERFCRMWECYLAMSESAFRWQDAVVFQVQLARRNDAVPLTRDYIAEREAVLKEAEQNMELKRSA